MISMISGPEWRNRKHSDLRSLVILATTLALRLYFLWRPLNCLVSFMPADDFFYYANRAYHIVLGHGRTFDGRLTFPKRLPLSLPRPVAPVLRAWD